MSILSRNVYKTRQLKKTSPKETSKYGVYSIITKHVYLFKLRKIISPWGKFIEAWKNAPVTPIRITSTTITASNAGYLVAWCRETWGITRTENRAWWQSDFHVIRSSYNQPGAFIWHIWQWTADVPTGTERRGFRRRVSMYPAKLATRTFASCSRKI